MIKTHVMRIIIITGVLLIIFCKNFVQSKCNEKVLCYYNYTANFRPDKGKFTVNDIDSSLCTHIIYGHFGIDDKNNIKVLNESLQINQNDIEHFIAHKAKAKALAAIGGNDIAKSFKLMTSDAGNRTTFVLNVMKFLDKYKFDGVIIEWVYTNTFAEFIQLMDAFDDKFSSTNYLIGLSLSHFNYKEMEMEFYIKMLPHIIDFVDFINVQNISYGLFFGQSNHISNTLHASPLHLENDKIYKYITPECLTDIDLCLPTYEFLGSQASSISFWNQKGAPKEKLIFPIPLFGRSWTLSNSKNYFVGSMASGPGPEGVYSKMKGILTYNEICSLMKDKPNNWQIYREQYLSAVYAVNSTLWVSYDDASTVKDKANWIKDHSYGGVSVYALSDDDFDGDCGKKYPLLSAINDGLKRYRGEVPEEHKVQPEKPIICTKSGIIAHPKDCRKYYNCTLNDFKIYERVTHMCDYGWAYDKQIGNCVKRYIDKACINYD